MFKSILQKEKYFILSIVAYIFTVLLFIDNQIILAWLACSMALYAVIANDSIQTIGTFLFSNESSKKFYIWLFLSSIYILTLLYGWNSSGGRLDFGRLSKIPEPSELNIFHLLAPLLLLALTRFKIPASTTFLILCLFSSGKTIESMLVKSGVGYIVSFLSALILTYALVKSKQITPSYSYKWRILQLFTTSFLWFTWLTHDVANIVVFLPRAITAQSLVALIVLGLIGLAMLIWLNGGRIQEIVRSKSDISDYKSATIVDFTLACVLFYFKEVNSLPMSTTFVFLGVLGGRELALSLERNNLKLTLPIILKDVSLAVIGILLSIALASFAG